MKVRVIAAVALGLVIAVGLGVRPADSQSRIISFSEIKPGMEGFGKTVIKGTEIQTFSVKVIDVIDNPGGFGRSHCRSGGAGRRSAKLGELPRG
jgi:hypothetical protein